jgi:hypothetical protein
MATIKINDLTSLSQELTVQESRAIKGGSSSPKQPVTLRIPVPPIEDPYPGPGQFPELM